MTQQFKLRTDYYLDQRLIRAGERAEILFVRSLAYIVELDTQGVIHREVVPRLTPQGGAQRAEALVVEGIWTEHPDGWYLNRWRHVLRLIRAHIPDTLRANVYARDGFACVRCGARQSLSLDHVIPWSLGGQDTVDNLQTLCLPCNQKKGVLDL